MKNHTLSSMSDKDLFDAVKSDENINNTKLLSNMLSTDPIYGPMVMDLLNCNKPETRAFVTYIARQIAPMSFLEVGVRRGWSTAAVAIASPECEIYAFDQWHINYAGVPNPGPSFVTGELAKLGYTKPIHFVNGNSHETIKIFFKENPNKLIDLILVDGDHSPEGALLDLMDTMPHIAVGGVMIFDDLINHLGLQDVWDNLSKTFPNFKYFSFRENEPGVGCAVRVY